MARVSSSGWRRRRRSFGWRDIGRMLRRRQVRRIGSSVIAVVLIGYVWYWYDAFRTDAMWWSDMGIGELRQDVQYGVGNPQQVRAPGGAWRPSTGKPDMDAEGWAYANGGGGRVEVMFDPRDGRSDSVTCLQPDAVPQSCQPIYHIGLGLDEESLTARLGAPTSSSLAGQTKIMRYDDLGVEFALQRYIVYRITTKRVRGSAANRAYRFARYLVPFR